MPEKKLPSGEGRKKRITLHPLLRYSIIIVLGMLIGLAAYYIMRKSGY